ncbi:putative MFS family arabinose efflux permease [Saccharothrix ecbatanensis]|uniref:Putative MFS family arabinose efflux permease n=1 Tax=Saccharothrix ecbatanensis TaxID=1105145 RepID=A0A7W9HH93_9PSEU|nr:MFS transporter [Saccharothrix ecbatanensis]MBB5802234.1 putative MFS family arabinose efflux permease [Saccharothrix ecbatanensis]
MENRSTLFRQLLPLSLALFAVGTDGFVIAGLLPQIAADLDVGVSAAGQLVTAFALAFAVSAPVVGALTSSMDRRTALHLALAVFVVGNVVTAIGPDYRTVMIARVVTAVGAGLIGSAAFSAAAAIAPDERRGQALAFVMGGLTLAIAFGLPAGTLIGGSDWRVTLWGVAGIGVVAAVGVAVALPPVSLAADSLRARLAPLREGRVFGMLAVTLMSLAGTHVLYTYISPAVGTATSGSTTSLTVILLAWGVGNMIGNTAAGRLADRYRPERVVSGGLAAAAVVLAISPLVIGNLAAAIAWALVWGVFVSLPVVPQQSRLVEHAPSASAVLLGLNNSAIYMGVALGGVLGGLLQGHLTPARLGLVAAGVSVIGLLVNLTTARRTAVGAASGR